MDQPCIKCLWFSLLFQALNIEISCFNAGNCGKNLKTAMVSWMWPAIRKTFQKIDALKKCESGKSGDSSKQVNQAKLAEHVNQLYLVNHAK